MKLTRRQLLLGGLTVGVAATGIHEAIRLRRAYAQSKLSRIWFKAWRGKQ